MCKDNETPVHMETPDPRWRRALLSEADAHLIAAAPELLELLGWAVELLGDRYSSSTSYERDVLAFRKRARAAIARAKGEKS